MALKYPIMRDGFYYGNMTTDCAKLVSSIREMSVVKGLKRKVFNFEPEMVLRSIEEERSIREIVKEEDIDITPYVGELRDYQTVGTAFMYVSRTSMIGDGVGLG